MIKSRNKNNTSMWKEIILINSEKNSTKKKKNN